jgi:hypothetical protein
MPTCRRHYPGRSDGVHSLVFLHRQRPSLCESQVGACDYFFGACSAFTHVTACMLAESPKATLSIEGFSSFVASTTASIATGWSEPVPGRELHPLKSSAFSRRTFTSVTNVAALRRQKIAGREPDSFLRCLGSSQDRIMISSILNLEIARSACGRFAGIKIASPAPSWNRLPAITISALPSSTCTKASNGAVCSLNS